MADSNSTRRRTPFEIGVQEGEIRNRHTAQGTGAIQQKLQRPVQAYVKLGSAGS